MNQPLIGLISARGMHLLAVLSGDFAAGIIRLPLLIVTGYLLHLAFERPFMSGSAPQTEREAEVAAITSPAP